jgi:hypothetical protein
MGAMSASIRNPALKGFHDCLAATGEIPKVVVVAAMHMMLAATAAFSASATTERRRARPSGAADKVVRPGGSAFPVK